MKEKSSSGKVKKKGGCQKYFLYIFLAVMIFRVVNGIGDKKGSSNDETTTSINVEASVNSPEKGAQESKDEIVSDQFEVYFIDVGQGDASLIICDGHSMLIDGGRANQSDKIYTLLKEKGIIHLDYIVATHSDDDHIGGLAGALNYASVDIALSPVAFDDSKSFENFKKYLDKQGIKITIPAVGDKYSLGNSTVTILEPVEIVDSSNNNSIVLKVVHGENSLLFTGDAEKKEENDIINMEADIKSSVLKISHHGSAFSTSDEWLDTVEPAVAVISCGTDNEYGHPANELLERLKARDIQTFRTDLQGDITIFEKDGKLICQPEKNPDVDVFDVGAIPEEESKTRPLQELIPIEGNEVFDNESITRDSNTENKHEKHEEDYIVNVKTGKFHHPDCRGVKQMKESNKLYVTCNRQELIDQGYDSCGICHP